MNQVFSILKYHHLVSLQTRVMSKTDQELYKEIGDLSTVTSAGGGKFEWRDNQGLLHRTDGPAEVFMYSNSTRDVIILKYFVHGKKHRDSRQGPAEHGNTGGVRYYENDVLHRLDGPAVILLDGKEKEWWECGALIKKSKIVKRIIEAEIFEGEEGYPKNCYWNKDSQKWRSRDEDW